MEWINDNLWLAWIGLALILAAVEAATVDFVFIMLSGGALAGSLTAGLGGSVPVQIVVAALVSLALLFMIRPIIKRHFMDTETAHGIGIAGLVGREALVLNTVTDHEGRVKLAGEVWMARLAAGAQPINAGQEVRVIAISGATAIVSADASSEATRTESA